MLYVAEMADDDVPAYGSVAPLKVGLLNDYPTRSGTDNDTGSGRHSRGDSGGSTGRQKVRLNDRGFNRRLRDA